MILQLTNYYRINKIKIEMYFKNPGIRLVLTTTVLLFISCSGDQLNQETTLRIIPSPVETKQDYRYLYSLQDTIYFWTEPGNSSDISFIKGIGDIMNSLGFVVARTELTEKAQVNLITDLSMQAEEAYSLKIDDSGVGIRSNSYAGFFYGIQSFIQLIHQYGKQLPFLEINDEPAFTWRGMHLDVSRHFFDMEFVKRYIDVMAFYKLNKLHFHLTDDQGWRMEIKQYPLLVEKGAWRKGHADDPWTYYPDPAEEGKPIYGGYYTQDELKELVAYAMERNIEIIPEIEMPGHSWAALYAYPELSCSGIPFKKPEHIPFLFSDPYCAGNMEVYTFLENILDEVIDVFPSKYIHLGGDEAKFDPWLTCEKCRRLMADENLTSGEGLQGYFINRITDYLLRKGKTPVGWDEVIHSDVSRKVIITAWQNMDAVTETIERGYKTVLIPSEYFYFNRSQFNYQLKTSSERGVLPFDSVYLFNTIEPSQQILGIQGALWTEYIPDEEKAFSQLLPRLLALSELAWNNPANKDISGFRRKVAGHFSLLNSMEYPFFIEPPQFISEHTSFMDRQTVSIKNHWGMGNVLYRLNKQNDFIEYTEPFEIEETSLVETIVVFGDKLISSVNSVEFKKLQWIEPVSEEILAYQPGLLAEYKEDSLQIMKNFSYATPDKTFITQEVSIPDFVREDYYYLSFEGFLFIEKDDLVELTIKSDDGSFFWLHDELLIDNDGIHAPTTKSVTLALKSGLHPVKIEFFEGSYGEILEFEMNGSDSSELRFYYKP